MANFPIEYSQGQLSGGGGAPRASIGSPVGQLSLARATGDLGNTLFDISQKAEKAEAAMELSGLQRQYEEAEATMLETLSKMDDEEARQKFYEKWKEDTPASLVSKRDRVNQSMKIYLDRQAPQTDKLYQSLNTTLKVKSAKDKWEFNAVKNLEAGNFEAYSRDAKIALDTGLIGPEEYQTRINDFPVNSTFARFPKLVEKDAQAALDALDGLGDNLTGPQFETRRALREQARTALEQQHQTMLVGVMGQIQKEVESAHNKQAGYELIDKLQAQGQIGVEDNYKLGNWLDNYWEGRKAAQRNSQIQKTLIAYDTFIPKLLDGTLTADEVAQSEMDAKTKEAWMTILLQTAAPASEQTEWDGFNNASGETINYALGIIDKKTAIDGLLEDRYINRTLSDADFRNAIRRIQEPYPKDFARKLQGAMGAVVKESTSLWKHKYFERQRAMKVNSALMEWVDREIANGKYPNLKEMYVQARELGVSLGEPDRVAVSYPQVASDADFDALPPGAIFIDPEGNLRRKP